MNEQLNTIRTLRRQIRELTPIVATLKAQWETFDRDRIRLEMAREAEMRRIQEALTGLDQEIAATLAEIESWNEALTEQDRLIVGLNTVLTLMPDGEIIIHQIPEMLEQLQLQAEELQVNLEVAIAAGDLATADTLRRHIEENQGQQQALSLLAQLAQASGWSVITANEIQEALQQPQGAKARYEQGIARQTALLANLQAQRAAVEADTAALEQITLDLGQVTAEVNSAHAEYEQRQQALTDAEQAYQAQSDGLFQQLNTGVPIALLPVRLETRFKEDELLVRVYPDDIHQGAHEPKLTPEEADWRANFQKKVAAGKRTEAWKQMVERYGVLRAAYIVGEDTRETLGPGERRTHLAETALMPDRWIAAGYTGTAGQLVQRFVEYGEFIPQPLKTGIAAPADDAETLQSYFDDETRWMIDFDEAVDMGMGIRVPLAAYPDILQGGLALLLVFGVKATQSEDQSAKLLEDAFIGHTHTWGMGLVPQGTPTNNTEERTVSYSGSDSGSQTTEWMINGLELVEGRDGYRLARALGLDDRALARADQTQTADQSEAAVMNTALYPATWGYFLSQMLFTTFPNQDTQEQLPDALDQFRQHFIDFVRARGPLPVLRVHNQPYGVLPVSSLIGWQVRDTPDDTPAVSLLKNLLDYFWRPGIGDIARMSSQERNGALARVLSLQAASRRFLARAVLSKGVIELLLKSAGVFTASETKDRWEEYLTSMQEREKATHSSLHSFLDRLNASSRLFNSWYSSSGWELDIPLVQSAPLSEAQLLDDNYIAKLATIGLQEVHNSGLTAPKAPLLFKLLRHSLLLVAAETGFRIMPLLPVAENSYRQVISEPDLLEMEPGATVAASAWRYIQQTSVPTMAGPKLLAEVINAYWQRLDPNLITDEQAQLLSAFRDSLRQLGKLPSARLERLLTETLDLSSHRLDAWITSLFTQRLKQMRETAPHGLHLGGYGWVENLRPRLVPGVAEKRMTEGGYIHAPSTTHAAAAAILRSGYLSPPPNIDKRLWSVNLSSERVRKALSLLEGVRAGQPFGALLGYQFERFLHDQKLDALIDEYRELAPLVAKKQIPAEESVESIAARNVVDGLALLRRWQTGRKANPNRWEADTIPKALHDNSNFIIIEKQLTALEDAEDAIADLLLAESVYQLIQGKSMRTGASLDALSRGETPPAEFEVVKSARSGIGLTHRVMLVLNDGITASASWKTNANQARAIAEPALNAWAGKLFGEPGRVAASVSFLDGQGQKVEDPALPAAVRLSDLPLSPLDVLYMAITNEGGGLSLLEQWLTYHLMAQAKLVTAVVRVEVDFDHPLAGEPQAISFAALLELARAVRLLLANSRPLWPEDFVQPGQAIFQMVEAEALGDRVNPVSGTFHAVHTALDKILKPDAMPTAEDIHTALLSATYFGVNGALPRTAGNSAEDLATLLQQAKPVFAALDKRKQQLDDVEAKVPADDQVAFQLARLEAIFGEGFMVAPLLKSDEIHFSDLWSQTPQGATPAAVFEWLTRASRLRDRLDKLQTALLYAGALGGADDADSSSFHVTQHSATPAADEKWVGLDFELPDGKDFPGGRLSLVINEPFPLKEADPICGLLIDDWVEVVPNRSETTGVSFHFDAPQASAPQAILLAVHPVLQSAPNTLPWNDGLLADVLLGTYELVQIRLVTPDPLGGLAHYLPALFFARNTESDATVSTDFTK